MPKNIHKNRSNSGFTLLEILVVTLAIAILSAIAIPSWLSFVELRRLNTAQGQVYTAMQRAKSQAMKEKVTWQASFRENSDGIVQWAVHPSSATIISKAQWNDLESGIHLDADTTLQWSNGVRRVRFDFRGTVTPPLGNITLNNENVGQAKRCVYVSTILGAMRTGKEHPTPNDSGKYCY
ncbi:MAG: type II secretion system GspH family protein [Cyanomargarita calcarea GSE-NOS-MK-12-04C]|jgi:prepilin-type N-terminal cleavage/methylation domain-containing protein|uniref:Type II secretion system GspH family protein n=1 Tax=Cyanomargarita calcarea GSE-NOS-MK-12-04C TaxID=2839659 RepID=A0A951QLZ2_9CYAN|nr:type II secretion system GspH family protein [Cyanomargarita calcarea GSE-NOS-MK-12-04C]